MAKYAAQESMGREVSPQRNPRKANSVAEKTMKAIRSFIDAPLKVLVYSGLMICREDDCRREGEP